MSTEGSTSTGARGICLKDFESEPILHLTLTDLRQGLNNLPYKIKKRFFSI